MKCRSGFTLIELLTTISVLVLLMAVLVPAMVYTRRYARSVLNVHHQKNIVLAVTVFACENNDNYPESVALNAVDGRSWRWQDPRQIKTCFAKSTMSHFSLSGYLRDYIADADTLYCPSAPSKYTYWQQAWQAGDEWDHPETEPQADPVLGTYCLFWNYVGYIEDTDSPFVGPTCLNGGPRESTVLVSDYLGYDNWRMPLGVGSCEYLPNADVASGTYVSSDFWGYKDTQLDINTINVRVHAGYTDGHVARFDPSDAVTLRVAYDARGTRPFPRGFESPGEFFIPSSSQK